MDSKRSSFSELEKPNDPLILVKLANKNVKDYVIPEKIILHHLPLAGSYIEDGILDFATCPPRRLFIVDQFDLAVELLMTTVDQDARGEEPAFLNVLHQLLEDASKPTHEQVSVMEECFPGKSYSPGFAAANSTGLLMVVLLDVLQGSKPFGLSQAWSKAIIDFMSVWAAHMHGHFFKRTLLRMSTAYVKRHTKPALGIPVWMSELTYRMLSTAPLDAKDKKGRWRDNAETITYYRKVMKLPEWQEE
ncbi:hypothetical protein S7711_10531 [Stachybotrys chartarum IBT 7711]|uniref:Uncharacterized protein n=1 Tax=Stachybotrys chartarum (strain CBS 109288 / IBT 7711) TaxID=1280523 RepID=A0A084AN04_STACB|nr:hypothetical protein S7711_10531 [Stachybotrys chartarum IBT 7711]KFA48879.1 hypothetical protein S40293_10519 [Stachybotrys chartarum IBT 40293]KFA78843.1 hypothetical protein S40288_11027 [Stachybotrys chartarum IBT 40288]